MSTFLLSQLQSAGFTLWRQDNLLIVEPKELLTDELRNRIRSCKAALLSVTPTRQAHSEASTTPIPALDHRIRAMAVRWQYSAEELADALSAAAADPPGWLRWTERDERNFGNCRTSEEFAVRFAQLRRL